MQRSLSRPNPAFLAMLVACIAVFLTALDQTVVVTALPQIISDLQIPILKLDHAAWIVSGYLLGYVIVMPLMGRISDLYGRRRVFIICLVIFGLGSLFCGLAPILGAAVDISFLQNVGINVEFPGLVWLVAARFVQAVGGGAIVPVAMAIASDFYGARRLGLALGLVGMVTETGGVLGPLYGSVIVQTLGWQYIFYLNVPIVALLLVLTWFCIPRGARLKEPIDLLGTLLLGASLLCLSLGLAQEAAQIVPGTSVSGVAVGQNNPWLIAAAIILLIAFISWEMYSTRHKRWPIVELALFRRPAFAAPALVSLLIGAALIIAMVDIPIFIATVLGLTAIDSGLALLRLTAMIPVGALIGGWLCARITCRLTAVLGLIPAALGFWLMHLWPLNVDWTQITISTLLGGLGFGLVIAPIGTSAINAARLHYAGMASAVVTSLRMVGMILGLAALTSWGLGRFRELASTFVPPKGVPAFSPTYNKLYGDYIVASAHQVYTAIFLVAGVLCLVALVPALLLQGKEPAPLLVRTNDKVRLPLDEREGEAQPEREAKRSDGQS